jgi:hypothetical protein
MLLYRRKNGYRYFAGKIVFYLYQFCRPGLANYNIPLPRFLVKPQKVFESGPQYGVGLNPIDGKQIVQYWHPFLRIPDEYLPGLYALPDFPIRHLCCSL